MQGKNFLLGKNFPAIENTPFTIIVDICTQIHKNYNNHQGVVHTIFYKNGTPLLR